MKDFVSGLVGCEALITVNKSLRNVVQRIFPGFEGRRLENDVAKFATIVEQCQVVVLIADGLGLLGPGGPDLMTELCPPQNTA